MERRYRPGTHDGMICTGETYKSVVKLTFAKGASLDDLSRASSTPASTGTPGVRSTFTSRTHSMRWPSWP